MWWCKLRRTRSKLLIRCFYSRSAIFEGAYLYTRAKRLQTVSDTAEQACASLLNHCKTGQICVTSAIFVTYVCTTTLPPHRHIWRYHAICVHTKPIQLTIAAACMHLSYLIFCGHSKSQGKRAATSLIGSLCTQRSVVCLDHENRKVHAQCGPPISPLGCHILRELFTKVGDTNAPRH